MAFNIPDIPPGARHDLGLVLTFIPGDTAPWSLDVAGPAAPAIPPDSYRIIAYTDGRYVHEFPFAALTPRQIVVEDRLAGALELGIFARTNYVYLPLVTSNYEEVWWPKPVEE